MSGAQFGFVVLFFPDQAPTASRGARLCMHVFSQASSNQSRQFCNNLRGRTVQHADVKAPITLKTKYTSAVTGDSL